MSKETNSAELLLNQNVAPEQFDWDSFESGLDADARKEKSDLEEIYNGSLNNLDDNDVLVGKVVRLTDKEAIVDINFKSEGVISLNEFRYNQGLKVGDEVEVMVDRREDKTGQLQLSHKKARTLKAWDKVNELHETGEIVNGFVKSRTKGGMIVDVHGIEAFLPGSQIDVKPIKDYDQFVGKTMEFKVVKINPEFKNVVVSHKALIEADIEGQKKEIIAQLEKGQVLEGTVKNITSYGVFIDLGGVDGLIHITDLSWSRVNHPSEILEDGQTVKVVILDFDDEKTRIQLGMKQLEPHPWDALSADLKVGDKVKGKVVVLADYGAFVEIAPGVEGLIHVSEMSWSTHLRSAGDFVKVGDEVEAEVLTLDREERKISLGIKQLSKDPWENIEAKYPVGSQHVGTVRNFTNFGVFVELEEGIDGLIYISDLSWTKKIKHPSEFCAVGDKLDVVVLELDIQARRLSLGHKQLTENPWDTFETKYAEGTIHAGKAVDVHDKGASVQFEDAEVEAFCPSRLLEKEDGSKIKKGEEADFKVIEFNKEFKRVVVSHTGIFRDEEKKNVRESSNNRSNNVSSSSNEERSTLGDIDALAELKRKMEEGK
ncbi:MULTISPECIES: 30S ribosomal protein S1 [Chryseobacterium]|uniref:Small subunit ribosomal protein S1 n=1 Tax=Chryseobacterium camelliae TaxID=1265445 RepID=A0ABU0TEM1_9FLAO|nr:MULTISPECIES: 30S ribosomal protein S1 [Chryseobacterium]MDT3406689.1 small subunit ribosomal protein S1 [Pseudacidovorax intermedius]MDQ1095513.1 small subunit ribosomal protein S1 [Chryseobacterium camelliae]MDQ1099450.1 small subunit ribosomal protein S1 [Chryseobacterium sp. SORGH_AS_1048]MDR6086796.1 small subunit ribosomal protein S1 [Chryseobacterium sp. SORGH_AS_0909]MDR6131169.1 small subunit ribosomal protein S1 [Chryseobacterium sp. SORGH_AS_1175]